MSKIIYLTKYTGCSNLTQDGLLIKNFIKPKCNIVKPVEILNMFVNLKTSEKVIKVSMRKQYDPHTAHFGLLLTIHMVSQIA